MDRKKVRKFLNFSGTVIDAANSYIYIYIYDVTASITLTLKFVKVVILDSGMFYMRNKILIYKL